MSTYVNSQTRQAKTTITLSRPDLHNAFNEVVIDEVTEAFHKAGEDDTVRVVVLAAEGKSFCAGADVNWMKRMVDYSVDENLADAAGMANMLRTIRDCPKPVIARVHGAAIGGGVGLVTACDMAVALESAVFALTEVKLGIVPAVISPFVIEKIGPGHARRYALTSERFSAAEAKRIGLISEVVGTEQELDQWISDVTKALAANGPKALAACKKILTEVAGVSWDQVQSRTVQRIADIRVSSEGQEGLKAFLEKRKPNWAGE
ncbi:MAG: enoyl-CoA hydratase/isomerase family protein [Phycisphaerae bacterium]|nr:enoyl-CoA hydratase/isomerase family protein [Phycisphaerae bacterium]